MLGWSGQRRGSEKEEVEMVGKIMIGCGGHSLLDSWEYRYHLLCSRFQGSVVAWWQEWRWYREEAFSACVFMDSTLGGT